MTLARAVAAALAAGLVAVAAACPVSASAAGRWRLADARVVPLEYFQGLTHDATSRRFFAGTVEGLYRTDAEVREQARNAQAIPADLKADPGFNHIGDPTWDAAEGGRLLLPLECYRPLAPDGGNTCGQGAIGVVDPQTLAWRYVVRLDKADIPKAMWAEVSPAGDLLWTSSGDDLLAYRTADISPGAAAGPPIRPVARLVGAVPPNGVTGAVFHDGRLFLAGQGTGPLQIWSVDLAAAASRRLEVTLPGIAAESEGLDVVRSSGGLLHWLLSPFAPGGAAPTFGSGRSAVLGFVPSGQARLRATASPASVRAGRRTTVTVRVALTAAGTTTGMPRATVRVGGRRGVTGASGVARLKIRPARAGRLRIRATKAELAPATATLRVRAG